MSGTHLAIVFGLLGVLVGIALILRGARQSRRMAAAMAATEAAQTAAVAAIAEDHRRAEAQAAQLRVTLAGMSDGVMVIDRDLCLVAWNERFATIIGVPRHVLVLGTPMADIVRAQAEAGEFGRLGDTAAVDALVAERIGRLRAFRDPAAIERVRPNGRVVEMRRSALPDGGYVSLYTDITARKQAEAAERAAVAMAAEAVRQRQQFVAMVTHELRVPLDAVMHCLTLIEDGTLPETARGLVARARRAGGGLRDLIADILDLSRIDAGRLALRPADFDLPLLLGEICDMFRRPADEAGMRLMMVVDAGVPAILHGDSGRIGQVVANLVGNSLKYSTPGIVTLRATVNGRSLRISVADPGPAIPHAQAAALFRPFTRLASAEFGREKGTGLGLAICARLTELMGGEIGLAREGEGNAFWFSLPIDAAHGDGGVVPSAVARRPARRGRLLLVEDVASNRELTAALLRREGHRVDVAENGFIAFELATSTAYDLILMDIHMPGIDGIETARRIRALPAPLGQVPIVALTGTSSTEERLSGLDGALDAVLLKPVRPEDLLDTLRRYLEPWTAQPGLAGRAREALAAGVLDGARIAALRDGLAPGMFARLMAQCVADMKERLPEMNRAAADGTPALREAAHALAGMAGSYGLAEFEQRMRAVMRAAEAGAGEEAMRLAAGAAAALDEGEAALRAFMQAA